ncbi:hypothetical protein GN156_11220 [bacterium LRH843]|nr:hypothetical protein [bacterium LRH843]
MNNAVWSIIGLILVGLNVYLAVTTAVIVLWLVGRGLIGLIVLLVIFGGLNPRGRNWNHRFCLGAILNPSNAFLKVNHG